VNQPHDAIRPRRRRRQPMAATNPAVARAEQSTRILIRVPAMAGAEAVSTAPRGGQHVAAPSTAVRDVQQAATSLERDVKETRKEAGVPTSGLRALLNETTPKRSYGSLSAERIQTPAARSLPVETPSKITPETTVPKVETAADALPLSSASGPQYRLDAAHFETAGPHSAADAWQRGGSLLGSLLQLRSLLAAALIIAGVISAAIVLHNRTQHHALRPDGDPAANASQMDPKGAAPFPKAATGATGNAANQGLAGNQGPISAAANPAAVDARTGNPAAPSRWNAPAGANLPASVAPISVEQSTSTPSMPNINQDPFYSAQRVDPPAGAVDYRFSGPMGTAAFEGNINNPVQLSR
jgi:hypothetical protein